MKKMSLFAIVSLCLSGVSYSAEYTFPVNSCKIFDQVAAGTSNQKADFMHEGPFAVTLSKVQEFKVRLNSTIDLLNHVQGSRKVSRVNLQKLFHLSEQTITDFAIQVLLKGSISNEEIQKIQSEIARSKALLSAVIEAGSQLVQLNRAALSEKDILMFKSRFENAYKQLQGTPYEFNTSVLSQVQETVEVLRKPFHRAAPAAVDGSLGLINKNIASKFRELGTGSIRYPFSVEFSDGKKYLSHPNEKAEIRFVLKAGTTLPLALFGHQGFIDKWVEGKVDILGENAVRKMLHMTTGSADGNSQTRFAKLEQYLRETLVVTNKYLTQAKENAQFHYGNPNILFREMLGCVMKYSEGYFGPDKTISLDEAQLRAIEYWTQAGMNLMRDKTARGEKVYWGEVGGGWLPQGIFTSLNFSNVDFTNIGLVESQNHIADALIEANGLQDRVRVVRGEARDFNNSDHTQKYDIVHQVGVLEHAGPTELRNWISGFANAVKPGGYLVFSNMTYPTERARFVDPVAGKHFFPGGTMVSEGEAAKLFRDYGFSLVWKKRMNDDYALTLDHWAYNFKKIWPHLHKIDPKHFTESMRRAWELYVEGSAVALGSPATGSDLTLEHYVMQKGDGAVRARTSLSRLSENQNAPTYEAVLEGLRSRKTPKFLDSLPEDKVRMLLMDKDVPGAGRVGYPFPMNLPQNIERNLTEKDKYSGPSDKRVSTSKTGNAESNLP